VAEPPPTDAWQEARERARADVAAAYAPRSRTCPSCGREEVTVRRTCEHCGASYVQLRERRRLSRKGWAIVAAAVAGLAVAAALLIPVLHRHTLRDERRQAAAERRLVAAERHRLLVEQRPRFGRTHAGARPAMVRDVERAITADANARVRSGALTGRPVKGTSCSPSPPTAARRAAEADPATRRARYECVAYNNKLPLSELEGRKRTGLFGYIFYAVVSYPSGSYAFCKISPKAGEGGASLAFVTVPRPCRV
jgi:hypothetical protein